MPTAPTLPFEHNVSRPVGTRESVDCGIRNRDSELVFGAEELMARNAKPHPACRQAGGGESTLDASGRMLELRRYCRVMLVSSETRDDANSAMLS
jgi:hypothetical protein